MLFYYNRDGKFQKESSKEYKSEKGAVDRLNKEGVGAVFDETGKLILSLVDTKDIPEGALDTAPDGSVKAYDEDGNVVGSVDAATVEEVSGPAEEPQPVEEPQPAEEPQPEQEQERTIFNVHTTCDSLNIRALPDMDSAVIGIINEKEADKKEHPVSKVENGWGKLNEAPGGYIQLAYARVVS